MAEVKVQREAPGLVDYVRLIMYKIKQKYGEAICLMNDEVYGDQDVDIEIYSNPKSFVKWFLRVLGPKCPKAPLFGLF